MNVQRENARGEPGAIVKASRRFTDQDTRPTHDPLAPCRAQLRALADADELLIDDGDIITAEDLSHSRVRP